MRAVPTLIALCLAACLMPALPAMAAERQDIALTQRHKFDIHVQSLSSALRKLSAQSGVRILFPFDEVAPIRSRRILGWLSTQDALQRLLAGTNLKITQAGVGVIALASPASRGVSQQDMPSRDIARADLPGGINASPIALP
jgi:iron complex outermembrane receptor protein